MTFSVPESWSIATIGDISDKIHYGYTEKSSSKPIGPKFLRITDIKENHVDWRKVPYCKISDNDIYKYILNPNDIVFARTGATVGKSFLIGPNIPKAIFASYLIRIIPNSQILAKYVYLYFQSFHYWTQISKDKVGIGQPNVNATKLARLQIPLPPFPEQQRIVAKSEELLTRMDAGVDALKQVQAQLKRYRQSVLKAAVEGRLTTKWREQHKDDLEPADKLLERIQDEREEKLGKEYKESMPFNSSDLPKLPEEWVWASLEQVARFKNGINFTKDQKGDVGIPTIDVYNMYSAGVYVDTSKLYKVKMELDEDYFLHYGDILFVRSSVKREGVGWASTIKEDEGKKISFCGFIIRARLETEKVIPEFLTYFFRSANARRKIINASSQVTITNINQKAISRLLFPLMSMIEQQIITEEIDRLFSLADGVEKSIEHTLNHARSLRQSILKRAFEGKLVPQNPNDKSASLLLERIKAKKDKSKKSKQLEMS